jgi:hypothetical protein
VIGKINGESDSSTAKRGGTKPYFDAVLSRLRLVTLPAAAGPDEPGPTRGGVTPRESHLFSDV